MINAAGTERAVDHGEPFGASPHLHFTIALQPVVRGGTGSMTGSTIDIAGIEAAEAVLGVSYTRAERELMLDNLEGQISAARLRRKLTLANDQPMASRFDPRLPGSPLPPAQDRLVLSEVDPGPLPTMTTTSPSPRHRGFRAGSRAACSAVAGSPTSTSRGSRRCRAGSNVSSPSPPGWPVPRPMRPTPCSAPAPGSGRCTACPTG